MRFSKNTKKNYLNVSLWPRSRQAGIKLTPMAPPSATPTPKAKAEKEAERLEQLRRSVLGVGPGGAGGEPNARNRRRPRQSSLGRATSRTPGRARRYWKKHDEHDPGRYRHAPWSRQEGVMCPQHRQENEIEKRLGHCRAIEEGPVLRQGRWWQQRGTSSPAPTTQPWSLYRTPHRASADPDDGIRPRALARGVLPIRTQAR